MAVELIDSIVDRGKVGGQIRDTTTELATLQKQLVDTARAANQLNAAIGNSRTPRDFSQTAAQTTAAIERQNQALLRTQILQERLAAAQARREAAEARATQASQRATAAANNQASAYETLNAAYKEATTLARNAGAQYGANSQQFLNAARSANFLREQLDAIDRPLGNHQRNVGNYASAFDGLGNSIGQIGRELPSLAINFQTFALAISNNLPIFFDAIADARREIAELRAQGQATPGLFQRIAQGIFSANVVLSVGVALFTIFSKQIIGFVDGLIKGKDALDSFAEGQKAINDLFKSSNKEIGTQLTNLKVLYKAATDTANAERDRVNAAKELQKEFPETFKNIKLETILNGGAKDSYDQLTLSIKENARAKAAAGKISEFVAKQLDAEIQIQKIQNANQNEIARKRAEVDAINARRARRRLVRGSTGSVLTCRVRRFKPCQLHTCDRFRFM